MNYVMPRAAAQQAVRDSRAFWMQHRLQSRFGNLSLTSPSKRTGRVLQLAALLADVKGPAQNGLCISNGIEEVLAIGVFLEQQE